LVEGFCGKRCGDDTGSAETYKVMGRKRLEARVGIEPTHKGFADRFLVTPNPSDSTQVFIKLVFRPLFVRLGHEYSSDSGNKIRKTVDDLICFQCEGIPLPR
jgi:hypothetical protein